MSLARRLASRLHRFARRRGVAATLRVVTGDAPNADLTRTPTYADHPCRLLFDHRLHTTREGALVKLDTSRAILPAARLAAGVAPDVRSLVVVAASTYRVISAEPTSPGSPLIGWELELKL